MSAETEKPGCLSLITRLFGSQPKESAKTRADKRKTEWLPYLVRDSVLSAAEISFYHVLRSVVEDSAVITPKVRLVDIFYVSQPHKNGSFFNRIVQKHLDFLLCDPATMKPLVGIELDDSSHQRSERQKRDVFVDAVFAAANLPLLRFPARQSYNPQQISSQLGSYLQSTTNSSTASSTPTPKSVTPICPKCGIPMVMRKGSRGENAGKQFYGCQNYPDCRQTAPYTL